MRHALGIAVLSTAVLFACGTTDRFSDDDDSTAYYDGGPGVVRDGGPGAVRDGGAGTGEICTSFDNMQTCMCGPGQTCGAWATGCMCIGDVVDAGFRDGGVNQPPRDGGVNPPPRDGGVNNPPRDGGAGPRRDAGPAPTGIPVYNGTCPTFVDRGGNPNAWNYNTIQSSGFSRQFLMQRPGNPNPQNSRVVFVWHWWQGQADHAMDWMGLGDLTINNTYVISMVTRPGAGGQWETSDIQLFDDVLACMHENFSIDPDRVFVTGHSLGALFISTLIQYRAQYIAGFVSMSGGDNTPDGVPAWPINGLMLWGGPTDLYGSFSFETASLALSQALRNRGSFVMHCVGDFGHQLPPGPFPSDFLPFYDYHERGQPSPWTGGLPAGLFPGYCFVP